MGGVIRIAAAGDVHASETIRERVEKVWELDLETHGPRLVEEAAAAREQMAEAGVRPLLHAVAVDALMDGDTIRGAVTHSKSGPGAILAAAVEEGTPVTGTFAAMSIFSRSWLPPLERAKGKSYFILHPTDAVFQPANVKPLRVNVFEVNVCATPAVNDSPAIEPLPPFASKLTVYVAGVNTAYSVTGAFTV